MPQLPHHSPKFFPLFLASVAQNRLSFLYLSLHTILCSLQLYLFVQNLRASYASSLVVISLFFIANLFFALLLLSPQFSLRIIWAITGFLLLYLLIQASIDYFAGQLQNSGKSIQILYSILQVRMSLVLGAIFLASSILSLKFGKYRSLEAPALLLLSLFLLTREQLSLSFENRYALYRFLWLLVPALNLLLIGLSLHPYLRRERSWLVPRHSSTRSRDRLSAHRLLFSKRAKQITYFVLLLLLLFGLLWWIQISPIDWNRSAGGSNSGNGLLQKNLSNQFDFGEYLQLDSSLEQDRQLVMMAKIEDLAKNRPVYLTRFSLSGLDSKRSFFRDSNEPNMPGESSLPMELERGISIFEMPQYDLRQSKKAQIFLLNIKPSSLFVLNYPIAVQTFENWPDSSFSRVYQVSAKTLGRYFAWGEPLRSYAQSLPQENLTYYTQVPKEYADIGEFALQLLQELRGLGTSPQELTSLELAQLLVQYFHREYRYSLKPGIASDGDQLRYFLYDTRKGYCTYFAFSAALMLRSLGVPTRVMVGFLLNPELRILDYYPMFADQAHAWIEVFEPEQGWVTFDPTTFELAPGEEIEFGLPNGAEADLAALTEELLRNQQLNVQSGVQKLVAEKNPVQQILSQILLSLRNSSYLAPSLLAGIMLLFLLLFRTHIIYLAFRYQPADSKGLRSAVRAASEYLQWLNRLLFQQGQLHQQLYAWQDAVSQLYFPEIPPQMTAGQNPESKSYRRRKQKYAKQRLELLQLQQSTVNCLSLFQKYYFGQQFQKDDLSQLRKELVALPCSLQRKASWHGFYLLSSCYRYYFLQGSQRNWGNGESRLPFCSSLR